MRPKRPPQRDTRIAPNAAPDRPSSAVPLESMIEEMGYVKMYRVGGGGRWIAKSEHLTEGAPTVRAAIEALYAAWRERE